jgi:LacI family transcriptional regulator
LQNNVATRLLMLYTVQKDMAMTLKDLSEKIHVSPSTISRVMNNKPGISERTRNRVFEALKEQGMHSSTWKVKQAGSDARFIGLIVRARGEEQDNIFYQTSIQGCEVELNKHNIISIPLVYTDEKGLSFENSPIAVERFQGFILRGQSIPTECIASLQRYNVPIILLENDNENFELDSIRCNNRQLACSMTEHLIAKGYTRIFHITGPKNWYNNSERINGYRQALSQCRMKPEILNMKDTTLRTGRDAFLEYGNMLKGAGIFFVNDAMAIGFLDEAKKAGLYAPNDFAIAGFDDIPWATLSHPALTTAHVDVKGMARIAAIRMIDLLDGHGTPTIKVEMKGRLVIRQTT